MHKKFTPNRQRLSDRQEIPPVFLKRAMILDLKLLSISSCLPHRTSISSPLARGYLVSFHKLNQVTQTITDCLSDFKVWRREALAPPIRQGLSCESDKLGCLPRFKIRFSLFLPFLFHPFPLPLNVQKKPRTRTICSGAGLIVYLINLTCRDTKLIIPRQEPGVYLDATTYEFFIYYFFPSVKTFFQKPLWSSTTPHSFPRYLVSPVSQPRSLIPRPDWKPSLMLRRGDGHTVEPFGEICG